MIMLRQNNRLVWIILAVAVLLSIPLIAMQFTSEVNWDSKDFTVMSILLLSTGLLVELVLRSVKSIRNRIIVCSVVLLAFLLVWAELAVGIFGTPFAGH